MKTSSKNKDSLSYVESRDAERRAMKFEIRRQLAKGDYMVLRERSGKSISTVGKALNPNQQLWSQRVIDTAKILISERGCKI